MTFVGVASKICCQTSWTRPLPHVKFQPDTLKHETHNLTSGLSNRGRHTCKLGPKAGRMKQKLEEFYRFSEGFWQLDILTLVTTVNYLKQTIVACSIYWFQYFFMKQIYGSVWFRGSHVGKPCRRPSYSHTYILHYFSSREVWIIKDSIVLYYIVVNHTTFSVSILKLQGVIINPDTN